ncbi:MAG: YHS domain protein [Flavobacterium sp. BFFFF1]|uniref:YHS domain-containing (seleno)protein n=1 Tax=Flavobacterium sp. BFFFF1 TaxID=2015557 RepID=UPI000BC9B8D1|nr:YHS domain-containing (seleno)protein [Flavobacterium sp. BFFFF1]OYU79224.1 MAG: YHS domain protein [Flavobacterium sp. BFFFF1]
MKTRIFAFIAALISVTAFAQDAAKRKAAFNIENNVAIQGYDPVSYFKQGKALKGKKDLAVAHDGITYYFSSASNKDLFLKNPAGYEPQYGGWCAYAMGANAEKVEIDPETFKILDGKLYLFYNAYFNNTLKSWNKDEKKLKPAADNNWKKFIK